MRSAKLAFCRRFAYIIASASPRTQMTVNLSIRNVPDELAERLRARAKQNHRSLQGELMAMIEATATENLPAAKTPLRWPSEAARLVRESRDIDGGFEETSPGMRRMRRLTASEVLAQMRALGVRTPGSATEIVRRMRDERHR